jgi:hypothetical protein
MRIISEKGGREGPERGFYKEREARQRSQGRDGARLDGTAREGKTEGIGLGFDPKRGGTWGR